MLNHILRSWPVVALGVALDIIVTVARRTRDEQYKPKSANISIGRHSYGLVAATIPRPTSEAQVTIGSFCSIAPGVQILSHVDHPTNFPSQFPLRTKLFEHSDESGAKAQINRDATTNGPVTIGHDVWLGANAIVLSGVEIGTGAVVGAGAVVAKSVPPYAIVVGNPARIVRFRFQPEIVTRMLASVWWELPDSSLVRLEAQFYTPDIEAFLGAVKAERTRLNAVTAESLNS